MKTLTFARSLTLWLTLIYSNSARAYAEEAAREDSSDLFVWIFLAFCALIVLAQLVPAAMVLLGFAKGLKKEAKQVTTSVVDSEAAKGKTSTP